MNSAGAARCPKLAALTTPGNGAFVCGTVSGLDEDGETLTFVLARTWLSENQLRDEQRFAVVDRLARSTRDLLNTFAAITDRKAGFRSLTDTWADTTTSHSRLMLTVLGRLEEFERDLIRARTGEGRARAVARGAAAEAHAAPAERKKRSSAAIRARKRWPTSAAATMSAR